MNLWPFSKKNDVNSSHQLGNPRSGKIELPPGVMLVAPEQADLPLPQAKPEKAMSLSLSALTEKEEASRIIETLAPSFEDLTHIPATEKAEPSVIQAESTEKKDLAGFFEENQLKMVSQGALTEKGAPSSTLSQNDPKESVLPQIPDWPKGLASQTAMFSPQSENSFLTEIPATPKPDSPVDEEDLSHFFWGGDVPAENTASENSAFNDFVDMEPTLSNLISSVQTPPPIEAYKHEPATLSVAEPTSAFPSTDSPLAQIDAGSDHLFLAPAGNDETLLPPQDFFVMGDETSTVEEVLGLSALQNTDAYPPSQEAEALDREIEEAFLGEAQMELPQQLNLPDAALAPNGTHSFLAEVGLHTLPETACLDNGFDDGTFDLDSILLGTIPAQAITSTAFPESPPDTFLTENPGQSAPEQSVADLALAASPNANFDHDPHEVAHYFGDEAEGLKDIDNFESYDFGHYEEPGQTVEFFVLDEEEAPASACEITAYNSDYTATSNQLGFGELQLDEPPLEPAGGQGADLNDPVRLSFQAEADESSLGEFLATDDPPETDLAAPEEQEAQLEETSQEICEQLPSPQPEHQAEVSQSKSSPTKNVDRSKTTYVLSGDKPGSFELDMLLKNSQFLNRSIDHLVNTYFDQYNQEAS